ncbi:MAG: homocysteine S-methyltransferase family protein [Clostridia bacterium]|nr:homocysteine S-methyltransferase family protein [Clostridia bacterium]
MLQRKGVGAKTNGLMLNIENPQIVIDIHEEYLRAGSTAITTNTFGADRFHVAELSASIEEVIDAAINNAKIARDNINPEAKIYCDIAPTGKLLEPLGDLSFDDAYEAFKEQVIAADKKVDGFIIETFSDLYEMKAAILAVKENSDLPVISSCTFTSSGNMLTGASPLQMVTLLEALDVDMIALNCSLGPKELMPIVEAILDKAVKPLLVQPNAGLPRLDNGVTYYDVTPEEFASYINKMLDKGIAGFGGCCGTTPEHIAEAKKCLEGRKFSYRGLTNPVVTRVTGTLKTIEFTNRVVRCGERLNPTGKPKMKAALREERYDDIVQEGLAQVEAGSDCLDVNVGLPGIDETKVMSYLIKELQSLIGIPLQIDSSDPKALERACRIYNGVPLINSVNGKQEVMDNVFPIVKKYGGVVIGLCIGDDGIPPLAEDRFKIANKIIDEAAKYGIPKNRIIIDSLVLTASAQQKEVMETIKCVKLVTDKLNIPTCLGLSNVSFGLPNRPLINKTFLAMALVNGLKLPILNPLDKELMSTIDAFEVLNAADENANDYIVKHADDVVLKPGAVVTVVDGNAQVTDNKSSESKMPPLYEAIVKGQKNNAIKAVAELKDKTPLEIVEEFLIPALDKVGVDYDKGKIFLPQLMMSAETAKVVFDELKPMMVKEEGSKKGPVVIATVEADVHDIGKNIVKVVLESYGFEVIDLGKDVKASIILEAALKYKPIAIGLSALMTTTVVYMQKTIELLKENNVNIPTIVGGAVLTEEVKNQIGGTYYARDAVETVKICESLLV